MPEEWNPEAQRGDSLKISKSVRAEIGDSETKEPKPTTRHYRKPVAGSSCKLTVVLALSAISPRSCFQVTAYRRVTRRKFIPSASSLLRYSKTKTLSISVDK